AAPWSLAQQPSDDVSSLVLGQSNAPGSTPSSALPSVPEDSFAAERDATSAAALLGTDYEPAEDAMFGVQLFQPGMGQTYGQGFNADYTLAIGDRVALRMWGAFSYQDVQTVDPQGNVFLPNVGPVAVAGVRNTDLNDVIRSAIREVYRANV